MIFQYAAILACLAAGVMQLLALKLPHGGQPILRVARRITAVALLTASAYLGYEIQVYGSANVVYAWLFGLFGLSQLLFSMHTFMEPQCATRLIQSRKVTSNEATHA